MSWYQENKAKVLEAAKKWKRENPEKHREMRRRWYAKNKEKQARLQREYFKRNPGKSAIIQRKSMYGLSDERFQQMFISQSNSCGICKTPFSKTPHVDHSHETGKIRGLLCGPCNHALGHLKDDFSIAIRAADYLRRNL